MEERDRFISSTKNMSDVEVENKLRPMSFDEYVGQEKIKSNLKVFISAAKKRKEALDHVLLYGPPGLGKTSLANIISNEMGARLITISGPAIEKIGDVAAILSSLKPGDVLFIDEIHRLPRFIEETLYSAMEDFKFMVVLNRESGGKTITIDLPPFTLVGATTRVGEISAPLRARFGITEKLDYYSLEDLTNIVIRTGRVLNTTIDQDAAMEIAKRSRGTPRIANRLFKRVRDFANFKKEDHIVLKDAKEALLALGVDEIGLDEIDVKYLTALIKRFNGGPVGIETLANTIGEESTNLEDLCEPYLIQIEFIDRTPKGRVARKKAYRHLKIAQR